LPRRPGRAQPAGQLTLALSGARSPLVYRPLPDMNPIRVLFVCIHNSARSQMAEAYLNHLGGGTFAAESAGLEPGVLNPGVVQVLQEDGMDISRNKAKSVFEMLEQGRLFDFVITVCDETSAEKCPVFPG